MTVPEDTRVAAAPATAAERAEQALWEEARRTGFNPLPVRVIQVETSSICNFRCASCALSLVDYDRPEKHMSAAEFARVLAAFPDVRKVELQGVGEVFLNPEALDLIRAAVERGVEVHTFSNASMITRDNAEALVRSGIAAINLSMDGADDETFRKLRKGGTLPRYKRSFHALWAARAALGSRTPSLCVMSVISKANLAQVPAMIAVAEELGADTMVLTKINVGPKPDQQPLLLGEEERAWLDALPPYRGRLELVRAYVPWTREERMRCYWPKEQAYVTVDGDVTPCCNYFDARELRLGNVLAQGSIERIWNDEPYREFRKRLLSGDLPSKCKTC